MSSSQNKKLHPAIQIPLNKYAFNAITDKDFKDILNEIYDEPDELVELRLQTIKINIKHNCPSLKDVKLSKIHVLAIDNLADILGIEGALMLLNVLYSMNFLSSDMRNELLLNFAALDAYTQDDALDVENKIATDWIIGYIQPLIDIAISENQIPVGFEFLPFVEYAEAYLDTLNTTIMIHKEVYRELNKECNANYTHN